MPSSEPFKWRHFQSDLILLNVRWYLRYSLSYRDLEEMMAWFKKGRFWVTQVAPIRPSLPMA